MSARREAAARRVGVEYAMMTRRSRELLRRCGVLEDDLSKVRRGRWLGTWRCGLPRVSTVVKALTGGMALQNGQLYLHVLSEAAAVLGVRRAGSSELLAAMSGLQAAVDAAESRAEELREAESAARCRSHELQLEWQDLLATRRQLDDSAEEREKHGGRQSGVPVSEEEAED